MGWKGHFIAIMHLDNGDPPTITGQVSLKNSNDDINFVVTRPCEAVRKQRDQELPKEITLEPEIDPPLFFDDSL